MLTLFEIISSGMSLLCKVHAGYLLKNNLLHIQIHRGHFRAALNSICTISCQRSSYEGRYHVLQRSTSCVIQPLGISYRVRWFSLSSSVCTTAGSDKHTDTFSHNRIFPESYPGDVYATSASNNVYAISNNVKSHFTVSADIISNNASQALEVQERNESSAALLSETNAPPVATGSEICRTSIPEPLESLDSFAIPPQASGYVMTAPSSPGGTEVVSGASSDLYGWLATYVNIFESVASSAPVLQVGAA